MCGGVNVIEQFGSHNIALYLYMSDCDRGNGESDSDLDVCSQITNS